MAAFHAALAQVAVSVAALSAVSHVPSFPYPRINYLPFRAAPASLRIITIAKTITIRIPPAPMKELSAVHFLIFLRENEEAGDVVG